MTPLEIYLRTHNPLTSAIKTMTPSQRAVLMDQHPVVLCEGGNQSGKTFTACTATACWAMNQHPNGEFPHVFDIWYGTTTFDLFAQQAWQHLQNLLLFPGESIHKLPTRWVTKVDWLKSGSVPKTIWLAGGNCIQVKTFDQGRGEWQAKTLYRAVIDEECPDMIWEEVRARTLAAQDIPPQILVAATPIEGQPWLAALREQSMQESFVSHHRLSTLDNPAVRRETVEELNLELRDRPEMYDLRILGFPLQMQGLVYNDALFTIDHVIPPFRLDGADWTRYRTIDHGYRNCACLWMAINARQDTIVVYREYLGKERSLSQNAEAIRAHEGADGWYARSWIDPATAQTDACSGRKIIDLWRDKGVWVDKAPDNRLLPGIERVKDLMVERGGPNLDRPRLLVFASCKEFLRERRAYKWPKARPSGDLQAEKPEKRDDHLMDCLRYTVAAGIDHVKIDGRIRAPDKASNPVGHAFWSMRHMSPRYNEL